MIFFNYIRKGCGKTTLLNFLSGRVMGKNLKASGSLYVNSNSVENLDIIGNKMAYVMQDDILMPTFTPRGKFLNLNLFKINFLFY